MKLQQRDTLFIWQKKNNSANGTYQDAHKSQMYKIETEQQNNFCFVLILLRAPNAFLSIRRRRKKKAVSKWNGIRKIFSFQFSCFAITLSAIDRINEWAIERWMNMLFFKCLNCAKHFICFRILYIGKRKKTSLNSKKIWK